MFLLLRGQGEEGMRKGNCSHSYTFSDQGKNDIL